MDENELDRTAREIRMGLKQFRRQVWTQEPDLGLSTIEIGIFNLHVFARLKGEHEYNGDAGPEEFDWASATLTVSLRALSDPHTRYSRGDLMRIDEDAFLFEVGGSGFKNREGAENWALQTWRKMFHEIVAKETELLEKAMLHSSLKSNNAD
jgi:hypothetical protein